MNTMPPNDSTEPTPPGHLRRTPAQSARAGPHRVPVILREVRWRPLGTAFGRAPCRAVARRPSRPGGPGLRGPNGGRTAFGRPAGANRVHDRS